MIRIVVGVIACLLTLWLIGLWLSSATHNTILAAPAIPVDCGPPPTPEALRIEPVTSPTSLLTQTLQVYLGHGRAITVTSEAGATVMTGTFSAFTPTSIVISLLPNVTHHLNVAGQVEYASGCYYTLFTSNDLDGQPLTIIQTSHFVYLPIVLRDATSSVPLRPFPDTTNGIFVLNDQLATRYTNEV